MTRCGALAAFIELSVPQKINPSDSSATSCLKFEVYSGISQH